MYDSADSEALRWKRENEQTFEQPLGWIREAREKYVALRELCSRGKCHHPPEDARGTGADTQLGNSFFKTKSWAKEIQDTKKIIELHPHRFRHTFGFEVRQKTGSDSETAALLGHAGLKYVGRYVRNTDKEREDLLESLDTNGGT